jgi:hypothetical protein
MTEKNNKMNTCENCGKKVERLFFLGDAYASAINTDLVGVPYPTGKNLCITCVKAYLSITEEDLIREERDIHQNSDFSINLLKGRIGQIVFEIIFRNFGYQVYPFGYESYLTNIIKNMRKNWSNSTVKQIRSSPDTLIYDRELNQGFLLEIKSTTLEINKFWIEATQLTRYIELWSNAFLAVIHIPTLTFFCKNISTFSLNEKLKIRPSYSSKEGYEFNLTNEFIPLHKCFRLIDAEKLQPFVDRIKKEVLKAYGS